MRFLPFFKKFAKRKEDQPGFSLIEVIIVASITLLISLAVASYLINLQKEQKKQSLLQNLSLLKSQFENIIKNDASWDRTISSLTNASMACLRNRTKCNTGPGQNFVNSRPNDEFIDFPASEINLYDGANQMFYNGRKTSNTSGFTETGAVCAGFSYSGPGNDNCPIGYIVNWRALTNDEAPLLLISAKLVFNPSDSHPLKKLINATIPSGALPYKYGKYDGKVIRTSNTLAKAFIVTVPFTPTAGSCTTFGFGTCALGGAYTNYTPYSETEAGALDPYDLVTITPTRITIKNPGTYQCTVSTSAFAVNSVTTEIYRTSPVPAGVIASQISFASTNAMNYTNISLVSTFELLTANTQIIIRQGCGSRPALGPTGVFPYANPDSCALGFVDSSSYGQRVSKATLNCIKVE